MHPYCSPLLLPPLKLSYQGSNRWLCQAGSLGVTTKSVPKVMRTDSRVPSWSEVLSVRCCRPFCQSRQIAKGKCVEGDATSRFWSVGTTLNTARLHHFQKHEFGTIFTEHSLSRLLCCPKSWLRALLFRHNFCFMRHVSYSYRRYAPAADLGK